MIADDDKAVLAGEYVLGLLDAEERAWIERAREEDEELELAINAWQVRFQVLDHLVPPMTADAELWSRIETSLWPTPRRRSTSAWQAPLARLDAWLWSNAAFWRATGLTAALTAVVIAVATYLVPPGRAPTPIAVSVLESREGEPGWLVEIFDGGSFRVLPLVAAAVPADRSLELWTLRDPAEGPISLGLLAAVGRTTRSADELLSVRPGQLFEVSVEPPAGSPTGRPTGPVVFIGQAVSSR